MGVSEIKDNLVNSLNPSAFSLDSIPGIICIILLITLFYSLYKRATKAVGWLLGILIVYEAMYCLSLTGFNDLVHLSTVFKHDILVSIAQLFVGTPICTGLLYIASFIAAVMQKIWNICGGALHGCWFLVEFVIDVIKDAWQTFWNH